MVKKKDSDTEARILDAAHRVFVKRGTAGARTQEIAKEAGVNSALLHYYFRTKERLPPGGLRPRAGPRGARRPPRPPRAGTADARRHPDPRVGHAARRESRASRRGRIAAAVGHAVPAWLHPQRA